MNRKQFITNAATAATGLILMPGRFWRNQSKAALQLYTLRGELPKDVDGVLAKVATAGYTGVETYGYTLKDLFWGIAAPDFKKMLDKHQLTSPSGLYGIVDFLKPNGPEEDLKQYIETAATLKQQYFVLPYLFEKYRRTEDDYKRVAERMNRAWELLKTAGMKFAYHNHDFEFTDLGGRTGYDILLKETDPDLVNMELDIYWAVKAGQDIIRLFNTYPGRFALWHVKDIDRTNAAANTEIGNGSIDFRKIFANKKVAGLKHSFMEQENFSIDPFASITASAAYINHNLLR